MDSEAKSLPSAPYGKPVTEGDLTFYAWGPAGPQEHHGWRLRVEFGSVNRSTDSMEVILPLDFPVTFGYDVADVQNLETLVDKFIQGGEASPILYLLTHGGWVL